MHLETVRHHYLRRVIAPILRGLGIRPSTALARRLARGVFEMNGPGRGCAESRLRVAFPGATDHEITALAAASYEHLARFWTEALFIPRRLGTVAGPCRVPCLDESDPVRGQARISMRFQVAPISNRGTGFQPVDNTLWLRNESRGTGFRPVWGTGKKPARRIPGRASCTDPWRRYAQVCDEQKLHALVNSRRGCLLAAAYHGNPAAGACILGHFFRPVYVIVDFLAQPALASWQRELYAQPHVCPIERTAAAVRVPKVLSEGGAVLMVAEHERRHGRAVEAQFLGRPRRCYPTLGRLARWHDVPIGVVTCRRDAEPFSFTLDLHEVVEPGAAADDDETVVRRVMTVLERAIMQSPEQYFWSMGGTVKDRSQQDRALTVQSRSVDAGGEVSHGHPSRL